MFLLFIYFVYILIIGNKIKTSEKPILENEILFYTFVLISILLNVRVKRSNPGYLGIPIIECKSNSIEEFTKTMKSHFKSKDYIRFKLPMSLENYCSICRTYKNNRVYHCYSVGRCVEQFDHYCAILGNAIGKNNYKEFIAAIAFINIVIGWTLSILVSWESNIEFAGFIALIPCGLLSLGLLGFHSYLTITRQFSVDMFRSKIN